MEYCVAIRTLGTAGEKYQTLLDSLNRQTIRPKKILVYIPDGYSIPEETIEWEEYIRSPKGMITQRSLPFDEVDTDYILFCDDDLWLADDFVERLYKGLKEHKGDCISPDIYKIHNYSFLGKIKKAISGYAFPEGMMAGHLRLCVTVVILIIINLRLTFYFQKVQLEHVC